MPAEIIVNPARNRTPDTGLRRGPHRGPAPPTGAAQPGGGVAGGPVAGSGAAPALGARRNAPEAPLEIRVAGYSSASCSASTRRVDGGPTSDPRARGGGPAPDPATSAGPRPPRGLDLLHPPPVARGSGAPAPARRVLRRPRVRHRGLPGRDVAGAVAPAGGGACPAASPSRSMRWCATCPGEAGSTGNLRRGAGRRPGPVARHGGAHLYPTTRTASDEGLWDLYVDSGYFNISGKAETGFRPRPPGLLTTDQAMGRAPAVAACVWPSSRGVEAGMTMARPYLGSWVAYQLARRQDEAPVPGAPSVLRETLLHSLEHAWRDPGFRWFITWVQHAASPTCSTTSPSGGSARPRWPRSCPSTPSRGRGCPPRHRGGARAGATVGEGAAAVPGAPRRHPP